MAILGLGGLLGDAACALMHNGELKAAIEENKLMRGAHAGEVPCGPPSRNACASLE